MNPLRPFATWQRALSGLLAVLMALPANFPLLLVAESPFIRVTVNDGDSSRSTVTNLSFTLTNGLVPAAGGLSIRRQPFGPTLDPTNLVLLSLEETNTYRLSFTNLPGISLPDGNYAAGIVATPATNPAGPRIGDAITFHRLFGDRDGDRDVDFADTFGFRSTWLLGSNDAGFDARFDADSDGLVNSNELAAFNANYFTVLPSVPTLFAHLVTDDGLAPADGITSDPTVAGMLVRTNPATRLFAQVAVATEPTPPDGSRFAFNATADLTEAGTFVVSAGRLAEILGAEPAPDTPYVVRFQLVETNDLVSARFDLPFTVSTGCVLQPVEWSPHVASTGANAIAGSVTFNGCSLTLTEGDSFAVAAERTLTIPPESGMLRIEYETPTFDSTAAGRMRDAFEVALVDTTGRPLTFTIQGAAGVIPAGVSLPPPLPASVDACFNHSDGREPFAAPGVAAIGVSGGRRQLRVDLRHLATGASVRLVLRLVNNDRDRDTSVRISDIRFLPEDHSADFAGTAGTAFMTDIPNRVTGNPIPSAVPPLSDQVRAESRPSAFAAPVVTSNAFGSTLILISPVHGSQIASGRVLLTGQAVVTQAVQQCSNPLENGGFESYTLPPSQWDRPMGYDLDTVSTGSTDLTGWSVFSVTSGGTIDYVGSDWMAAEGQFSLDLNGTPGTGGIRQTFPTEAGRSYLVSFEMSGNPTGPPATKTMLVKVAGDGQVFSYDTEAMTNSLSDMKWQQHTFSFTAVSNQTILEFVSTTESDYFGPFLDNVSVTEMSCTSSGGQAQVVSVTVNGIPAEALDAAGGFFSPVDILAGRNDFEVVATDSLSRNVTNNITVYGVASLQMFSSLGVVSASVLPGYGRTSFNEWTDVLYADVSLLNSGSYPIRAPFYLGVTRISDPSVTMLEPDGIPGDGVSYYDFSGTLANGSLNPGQQSGFRTLAFHNPNHVQFTYGFEVLGQLNQPPSFTSVPQTQATIGKPYGYRAHATDPDGDPLGYSLAVGPTGMTASTDNGMLTWTPGAGQLGNHEVSLVADDGRGGRAEQKFVITVTAPSSNRPPIFTSRPVTVATVSTNTASGPQSVDLGLWTVVQLMTNSPLQAPASWDLDPSRTAITQSVNADASIFLSDFPLTSHEISGTWRVGQDQYDDDYMGFVFGYQDRGHFYLFDWRSANQNGLSGRSCGRAVTGMNVKVVATDAELTCQDLWPSIVTNDVVHTLFHNSIAWRRDIDYTFTLRFIPGVIDIIISQGTNILESITIHDDTYKQGRFGFYNFSQGNINYRGFTQVPLNQATYTYDADALDPDADELTYSLVSGPPGLRVEPHSGLIEWDPTADQIGQHSVVISADDGEGGIATQAYLICVTPGAGNREPLFVSQPVTRLSLHSCPTSFAGPIEWIDWLTQSGNSVTGQFQSAQGPVNVTYTGDIAFSQTSGGNNYWSASSPDPYFKTEFNAYSAIPNMPESADIIALFQSTGTNRNVLTFDPPALNPVMLILSLGQPRRPVTYAFDYPFSFLSSGNGYWGGDPAGSLTVGNSNRLTGIEGHGAIWFCGRVSEISWTAEPAEYWHGFTLGLASQPTAIGYIAQVQALDPDGDGLRYHLVEGPSGMTLDAITGVLSWNPGPSDSGDHPVIVRVEDGRGGSDTRQFTVEVDVGSPGSIRGTVWQDSNANQTKDGEESGFASGLVYLDLNDNHRFDADEPYTSTDPSVAGTYSFDRIRPGTYIVRQLLAAGIRQTFPENAEGQTVTVTTGQTSAGADFGNVSPATDSQNQSPSFVSVPPGEGVSGQTFRYQSLVYDTEPDALAFDLVVQPDGMTVEPRTGVVVWRPTLEQAGLHDVILRVQNGRGGVAIQPFTVTVRPPNSAPVLLSVLPPVAVVGQPYTLQLQAQDAEQHTLTFGVGNPPPGFTVNPSNGVVTWIPAAAQIGPNNMELTVTDSEGAVTHAPASVTILPSAVNLVPRFVTSPRLQTRVDLSYVYLVQATDPDADPVALELTESPAGMTLADTLNLPDDTAQSAPFNGAFLVWQPTVAQLGQQPVTLRATDGRGGSATQHFVLTVGSTLTNSAPVIVSIPFEAATTESLYAYDASADDADGDTVTWHLVSGPVGASINEATGALRWIPTHDQLGTNGFVIEAQDAFFATARQSFSVEVGCVNRSPAISSIPPVIAHLDEAYLYAPRGTDPDGDALVWSLVSPPAGMTVEPATGLIRWIPAEAQLGPQLVQLRVSDGRGGADAQAYTVHVTDQRANRSPVLTSKPVLGIAAGQTYAYPVRAVDPDGDSLTLQLFTQPDGAVLMPGTSTPGVAEATLTWTPPPGAIGAFEFILAARDAAGASAAQRFSVIVRTNNAPSITSTPRTNAVPGITYRYDVAATDPDGDALTYTLIPPLPAGMTMDTAGRIVWPVPASQSADALVTVSVSDGFGGSAGQSFVIAVGPDLEPPVVRLVVDHNLQLEGELFVEAGSQVPVRLFASDNVGIAALALTVDGSPVPLAANGSAFVSFPRVVSIAAVGTATDFAGNSASVTNLIRVVDPNAEGAVAITIHSPTNSAEVTRPVPLVATITSGNAPLARYSVEFAEYDLTDRGTVVAVADPRLRYSTLTNVTLPAGTLGLTNAVLARFDPTTLLNGAYVIRVTAYDANQQGRQEGVFVSVTGELKFGEFRLEFTDLQIPVAGIPITVSRVYDSREAAKQGDFGYGWRLGVQDARILPVLRDGALFEGGRVYLTTPEGRRVGFTVYSYDRATFGFTFGRLGLRPDPGVYDELAILGDNWKAIYNGSIYEGLVEQPFNPAGYRLTTRDGTAYDYDVNLGLRQVTDLNGNRLVYTRDGIFHYSAGSDTPDQSVRFIRDARGRITDITDPAGKILQYGYDSAGDLRSFTDQAGLITAFDYRSTPAHYLDKVIDPLGRQAVRTEYGEDGRIKAVIDALGNRTEQDFDPENFTGTQTDAQGNVTSLIYDTSGNLLQSTDPLGGVIAYTYDSEGNVTSVTDQNGNRTSFAYDARGNVAEITDPFGQKRTFTYNSFNKIARQTDQLGRQTAYEYDSNGSQTRIVDAAGFARTAAYDAAGRQISFTDPNGNRTVLEYENGSLPSRIIHADGSSQQFSFTPSGQLTKATDENGHQTLAEYDNAGRILKATRADGGTTTFAYTGTQWTGTTDALGRTTRFEYDASDRKTSETDPAGGITRFEYDEIGRLIRKVDPLGRETKYTYQKDGKLATIVDALGGVTFFTYDLAGNRLSRTDANGNVTTYAYDALNRRVSETDPLGNKRTTGYDAVGNRVTVMDELGNVTRYGYDALNRLVSITTPLGARQTFTHDANGNLVRETDPLGNATVHAYDSRNRIISTTDAEGGKTLFEYDAAGNRIALTDPVLNRTTFAYDPVNQVVRETDPLGKAKTFAYNLAGNLVERVDRNGRKRTFVYDALDRLTQEAWWDGLVQVRTLTFTFDAAGNRLTARDHDSAYSYAYDSLNRVLSVDNAGTPGAPRVLLQFGYDAVGNRVSVSDNAGVHVSSTYDARNILSRRGWQGGGLSPARVDFGHDARGRRSQIQRFSDAAGAQPAGSSLLGYDGDGRLTDLTHAGAGAEIIGDYDYAYDLKARVTTQTDHGETTDYGYDRTDQLLSAARSTLPDELFQYDANGNRNGAGYVVGPNNRMLADSAFDYAYDDEGNLISSQERATGRKTAFAYDHRNRLISVIQSDATGAVTGTVLFTYDVNDRRIAKTVDGQTTRFVHDGDATWADYDGNGLVTARYLSSDDMDDLVARHRSADETAWYLADRLGTVRALAGENGAVLNRLDLLAFGSVLSETTPGAGDRFKFTGREFDEETGLYFYRARYYAPTLGRFINEDPIGFEASDANLYRYAANNPANYKDPTGLVTATQSGVVNGTIVAGLTTALRATAAFRTVVSANGVRIEVTAEGAKIASSIVGIFGNLIGVLTEGRFIATINNGNVKATIQRTEDEAGANTGSPNPDPDDDDDDDNTPRKQEPIGNRIYHSSRKEAREAAERESPIGKAKAHNGKYGPHYHALDKNGRQLNHNHHYFPRRQW